MNCHLLLLLKGCYESCELGLQCHALLSLKKMVCWCSMWSALTRASHVSSFLNLISCLRQTVLNLHWNAAANKRPHNSQHWIRTPEEADEFIWKRVMQHSRSNPLIRSKNLRVTHRRRLYRKSFCSASGCHGYNFRYNKQCALSAHFVIFIFVCSPRSERLNTLRNLQGLWILFPSIFYLTPGVVGTTQNANQGTFAFADIRQCRSFGLRSTASSPCTYLLHCAALETS